MNLFTSFCSCRVLQAKRAQLDGLARSRLSGGRIFFLIGGIFEVAVMTMVTDRSFVSFNTVDNDEES
jgi:hypothetical protein